MFILFICCIVILTNILSTVKADREIQSSSTVKYLLVIDFEATCWEKWLSVFHKHHHEIIEFPCILYDVEKNKVLTEFQQYVKPTECPKLSKYCKELTGIQQSNVDNGLPLRTSINLFNIWLREQELKYNFSCKFDNCLAATWSDWDLGKCLKHECWRKSLKFPTIFSNWIDVRAVYRKHYFRKSKTIIEVVKEVGLKFQGRLHSGLDDSRNIANLIGHMIGDGAILTKTSTIGV